LKLALRSKLVVRALAPPQNEVNGCLHQGSSHDLTTFAANLTFKRIGRAQSRLLHNCAADYDASRALMSASNISIGVPS